MNKKRKELLKYAFDSISNAKKLIEMVSSDENEDLDNRELAYRCSVRGKATESDIKKLYAIEDEIQSIIDDIDEIM